MYYRYENIEIGGFLEVFEEPKPQLQFDRRFSSCKGYANRTDRPEPQLTM